ncbi:FadR/GntR family transcriptional regulator [Naasia lichenicola]|uniref:FadR family transcriptional regulator n=1 Tax=Naasia lichenicola TaxID=2565933 RepID=A0A4V6RZ10_9MICO|nr:FCD domain-containing protein [Naasia lichenicola]THG30647.1 FadR family transcriptional regulator [Naasia lichenicola]THG31884.1 FadR family transcriptional regulator [Naasia lichenicola]
MSTSTADSGTTTPEPSTPTTVAIDPSIPLGPLSEPIVARHIADDVVDRLVTAIALGVYVPGQQLPPERTIAGMLGVSRTTVREALKQLTESRYLAVRRGRNGGYFVLADWGPTSAEHVRRHLLPSWNEFEKLFDARTLLEPVIARTAARRCTPADAQAITKALNAYLAAPNHDASRQADSALHRAIAEATQNPILVELSEDLRARVSLNLGAEPYTDEVRRKAIVQHQELVAAVIGGDGELAADIAAHHFTLSEDLIRDLVARAQLEPTGDPS